MKHVHPKHVEARQCVVCGAPKFKYQSGQPPHGAAYQRFFEKSREPRHVMAGYFMFYSFARIHQTLKLTPAVAAEVTSKFSGMSDVVMVLEDWEVGRKAA